MIAKTPAPPYYAVIFTNIKNSDDEGYEQTAARMVEMAQLQPGFLGIESAREDVGITVSYWQDLESIKAWKANTEHVEAQKHGQQKWYTSYTTRIAKVQREYSV